MLYLRSPLLIIGQVEVNRRSYRSPEAWAKGIEPLLHSTPVLVTAPNTAAAVHALLSHFGSFFGGEPYVAKDKVDAVTIEPAGRFGLFADKGSWKRYDLTILLLADVNQSTFSGESLGDGVRKTIMTELTNEIFSDRTVWQQIGNTKVINTMPVGIPVDPERLRRLKVYGYVCRLYVVLEHALPPPMSILFAYAILVGRQGDCDVIEDERLLRMFAPQELQLLKTWPATSSEFLAMKNDPAVSMLALEYFGQPVRLSHCSTPLISTLTCHQAEAIGMLPRDTFTAYTINFSRQVLFGCRIPFSESPDICAFTEGFNGRIGSQSQSTLGQVSSTLPEGIV